MNGEHVLQKVPNNSQEVAFQGRFRLFSYCLFDEQEEAWFGIRRLLWKSCQYTCHCILCFGWRIAGENSLESMDSRFNTCM
jgi:hypothetical protein